MWHIHNPVATWGYLCTSPARLAGTARATCWSRGPEGQEGWLTSLQDRCSLTVWWGVSWKRLGDRMAGAKNLRKMKLLTAVYLTSRSSVARTQRQPTHPGFWSRRE